MLTKHQIAAELADMGLGHKKQIANILDGLAELAEDEIANGEDFTVPGICRISFNYRAPKAKGERWSKGDTVVGFGGIEQEKDADSPAVKALVKLRPTVAAKLKTSLPKSTDATGQRRYLSTKVGKYVAERKGK